jgi:hypothetical protein
LEIDVILSFGLLLYNSLSVRIADTGGGLAQLNLQMERFKDFSENIIYGMTFLPIFEIKYHEME